MEIILTMFQKGNIETNVYTEDEHIINLIFVNFSLENDQAIKKKDT